MIKNLKMETNGNVAGGSDIAVSPAIWPKNIDENDVLLMSCSSYIPEDYPWLLSPETEGDLLNAAVPGADDPLSLDVIRQPTFPSPNYESEVEEAVVALDAYLSPRAEVAMDFNIFSGTNSISEGRGPDDVDLECVTFNDMLDGNYDLPAISNGMDKELQDFLRSNSSSSNDNEEFEQVDVKEEASSDENVPRKTSGGKHKSCDILKENDNVPDYGKSQVVILQKKDGTSKVLNAVPMAIASSCVKSTHKPTITISSGVATESGFSAPRRSARTIRCSRSEPPKLKNVMESSNMLMYPSPSVTPLECEDKSRKNAIQAKNNRERKKAHTYQLEGQVSSLSKVNDKLKSQTAKLIKEKDSLAEEVEYLRSVIANQSALSRLLGNITDVKSVSLSSSFVNDRKRTSDQDHDYGRPTKSKKSSQEMAGGVCLHVENDNVSLEFCSSCARMARGASRSDIS